MFTILEHRFRRYLTKKSLTDLSSTQGAFYFGYGANMNPDYFRAQKIPFRLMGLGQLKDYEFSFNTPCEYKEKGFGGVTPKIGASTYGALYEIAPPFLKLLDSQEWVKFHFYRRDLLTIVHQHQEVKASVYIPCYPRENLFASDGYKKLLINGAKMIQAPADYIHYLEGLGTQGSFELDHTFNLRNPRKKRLLPSSCYVIHDRLREKLCELI
jgi:hypothetical protein